MSFSSDTKQELSKLTTLANKKLVYYELIGYLISSNCTIIENKKIRYATESDYNINRFSRLLSNLQIDHKIEVEGKSFVITLKIKNIEKIKLEKINLTEKEIKIKQEQEEIKGDQEKRAIIRGTFLGAGSINNPENTYHLELNLSNQDNLEYIKKILTTFEIEIKTLENKEKYVLYLKEGEEIANLLALMGASNAILHFEQIRTKKEMRGKVNRLVNCKTANLNKTINASIEQIEAIEKLQKNNKFNLLDENLKEIAQLRLENPDMALIELGKKLKNPVGKSGVNYRLKKIMEIANDLN